MVRPADYTTEKVAAAYATDCRTAHLSDAWAAIWARRIEGRLATLLAGVLDELRRGEMVATGRLAANPLAPIAVPVELFDAPATALDTVTGDIRIGDACAFVEVMVSTSRSSPRGISRSKLDRFTRAFGEAMAAMDRHFTLGELADAVDRELAEPSLREVKASIRRASPRAWAGSGRRAAALVPTRDELARAARQAAGTSA